MLIVSFQKMISLAYVFRIVYHVRQLQLSFAWEFIREGNGMKLNNNKEMEMNGIECI